MLKKTKREIARYADVRSAAMIGLCLRPVTRLRVLQSGYWNGFADAWESREPRRDGNGAYGEGFAFGRALRRENDLRAALPSLADDHEKP